MKVGPFTLEVKLGAGGMGEVWKATHSGGARVAVKFDLHPPEDHRRDAFLHEVRLVAGLDHEHCVQVYDAGIVTGAEARAGGPLREGGPWLAMELASGGSVADPSAAPTTWEEVRHVLRGLLGGLAHAHARGVVHRDIKPGNVLLAGPRGSRTAVPARLLEARPVLSDFGIGFHHDRAGLFDESTVGTPRYMAPEQIEALWRDIGPWTDLYQVGVMLWLLATGEYPFRHRETMMIYRAHLFEPPPAFVPRIAAPRGLEDVVRALLAKDARERPQFAAEALAALEALGDVAAAPEDGWRPGAADPDATFLTPGAATPGAATPGSLHDAPTAVRSTAGGDAPPATLPRATGPGSRVPTGGPSRTPSRTPAGSTAGEAAAGVAPGLGLWGLRPVPLVGRGAELARLRAAFEATVADGRPHAVVLGGPEGTGKSRLAQAFAEEAHERGLATVWRGVHGTLADEASGLDGMLRRELHLGGLTVPEAGERLDGLRLPGEPLARWLLGGQAPGLAERFALAGQVVGGGAGPRVVWLDDAHRSPETLAFVAYAAQRVPRPLLFLVTVRDEEVAADPELPPRIARLRAAPRVEALDVAPLGRDDHRALVRALLGLDGNLAAELEERTAGNARFAVALVDAWVDQGVLVPGPDGLRIARGATPTLPPSLVSVWSARVDAALRGRSPAEARALEIAAAIGVRLTRSEWARALEVARLPFPSDFAAELEARRLLRLDEDGRTFAFAHALLREEILRRAAAAGRDAANASAAADALATTELGDSERLGTLLAAAGRRAEAFEQLSRAVVFRHGSGDPRTGRLMDTLERLLGELGAPPQDARHGLLWCLRSAWHRKRGHRTEAEALLVRMEQHAERHGHPYNLAVATRDLATLGQEAGDFTEAIAQLERAEGMLRDLGRTEMAAAVQINLGDCWLHLGDLDRAEDAYGAALVVLESRYGLTHPVAPLAGLARLHHQRGDDDVARVFAHQAIEAGTRRGLQQFVAQMENLLGEMARGAGDLEGAVHWYQEAVRRFALYQDDNGTYPSLNLGLVQVLRGQFDEARAIVEPLMKAHEARGNNPLFVAFCASVLLPVAASDPDTYAEFDRLFERLCDFLEASRMVEKDIARLCELAASLLADPARAAAVRALAQDQRRRLAEAAR